MLCQLVKLFRDGEPVRMSKRAGDVRDAARSGRRGRPRPVRFMMLYRKNDAPLDFDFAKVTEQSKDNPVFYVQYAHARAATVFRNAEEVFPSSRATAAVLKGRPHQADGRRRNRADQEAGVFPATHRRSRARRRSRIVSLSTFMTSHLHYMASGPAATICHICDLFRQKTGL